MEGVTKRIIQGTLAGLAIAACTIGMHMTISNARSSSAVAVEFSSACLVQSSVGDGYCDTGNNNAGCNWDGGDCCAETCTNGDEFQCGHSSPFDCRNPAIVANQTCGLEVEIGVRNVPTGLSKVLLDAEVVNANGLNPHRLHFTWTAEGEGEVRGDGEFAEYYPSSYGDHKVSVTVSDELCEESASVHFPICKEIDIAATPFFHSHECSDFSPVTITADLDGCDGAEFAFAVFSGPSDSIGDTSMFEKKDNCRADFQPDAIGTYEVLISGRTAEECTYHGLTTVEVCGDCVDVDAGDDSIVPVCDPATSGFKPLFPKVLLAGGDNGDIVNKRRQTFHWSIVSAPAGSRAKVANSGKAVNASFVPDYAGDYTLKLEIGSKDNDCTYSNTVTYSVIAAKRFCPAEPEEETPDESVDSSADANDSSSSPEDDLCKDCTICKKCWSVGETCLECGSCPQCWSLSNDDSTDDSSGNPISRR